MSNVAGPSDGKLTQGDTSHQVLGFPCHKLGLLRQWRMLKEYAAGLANLSWERGELVRGFVTGVDLLEMAGFASKYASTPPLQTKTA